MMGDHHLRAINQYLAANKPESGNHISRAAEQYLASLKPPAAPVSPVSALASSVPAKVMEEPGERLNNLKQAYINALNTPGINPQIIALLQRQMMEQQEPEMIEVEPEPSIYDRILRHFADSEE